MALEAAHIKTVGGDETVIMTHDNKLWAESRAYMFEDYPGEDDRALRVWSGGAATVFL
ncbi:hypothetical protein RUND412_002309, partial [Rhizina undulata]